MNKKLFLTSAIAMGFVAPAIAEPTNTGSFPSNGYMQEDYTYTNAATSTNMAGVTEGEVNAVAEYENILYELARGKYLPASSETPIDCNQNGYYCPGDQNGVYYSSSVQGLSQCPNGYGNSATGAGSEDECFRTCNISNMGTTFTNIPHASAVSGNDYYGNGTDTCEPTACDPGWHVKPAVTAPNLTTLIGVNETGTGYTANRSNGSEDDSDNMSNSVISGDPMAFAVDYGNKGMIKGHGRCSTRGVDLSWRNTNDYQFASDHFVTELTDQMGQEGADYCYCHLDSYTSNGGSAVSLNAPWVYLDYFEDYYNCQENCASYCKEGLYEDFDDYLAFRATVFGAIQSSAASCEANTITINWDEASAADISANNAGTAIYGSDIRTPKAATTKPGQRFKGWRFVAPTPVQVGN